MQRRYSKQRELILNCVKGTAEHPTAEMIYQWLKPTCPNLSRGTVYRNLNLLVKEGLLERMPFSVERYDGRTEPHPHFKCQQCGEVTDLEFPYQAEMDQELSQQTGMVIQKHDLVFYGLCPVCAAKREGL